MTCHPRAGGRFVWHFAMARVGRPALGCLLAVVLAVPTTARAQAPRHDIGWRDVGLLATGVVMLMTIDQRVARGAESSHEGVRHSLAPFREFGTAPLFATVSTSVFLGGLITGNEKLKRSGLRLIATAALAGAVAQIPKYACGRERPVAREGAWDFDPFSGATSLASGHTTMAFAMATALSHEIHRPVISLGLYSVASLTAMSRIADDRHWLSDVVAGAAIGVAAAKFVYGDWTFFGIQAPRVLTGRGAAEVEWTLTF